MVTCLNDVGVLNAVEASYACRIGLASNLASTISTGWTQRLPLQHKATSSEVCSEQFLKTKAIKPVTKEGQHNRVEIGVRRQATPGYRGVS